MTKFEYQTISRNWLCHCTGKQSKNCFFRAANKFLLRANLVITLLMVRRVILVAGRNGVVGNGIGKGILILNLYNHFYNKYLKESEFNTRKRLQ